MCLQMRFEKFLLKKIHSTPRISILKIYKKILVGGEDIFPPFKKLFPAKKLIVMKIYIYYLWAPR